MILTVTLNPAIDRTIYINQFRPGQVNLVESQVQDPGGKGINVSRFMQINGEETLAMGFLAGDAGKWIEAQCRKKGISTHFVFIEGKTRTNQKLVSLDTGATTDLNEKGPTLTEDDLNRFLSDYTDHLKEGMWVVIAGSLPKGVPANFYTRLVNQAKARGAKVALDVNGELLKANPDAVPNFIKPNLEELESLIGRPLSTHQEIREAVDPMLKKGIERICVSLGAEGSLFIDAQQMFHVKVPRVTVLSTVGAGDSMVSGYVYGQEKGLALTECIQIAAAASVIAVTKEGTNFASNAEILKVLPHLQIVKIK